MAIASEARAFRAGVSDPRIASEARALEASSLIKAALLGDQSAAGQYPALVEQVKEDTRLLSPQRFEVVALAELQMLRGVARGRGELMAARENSARYLMTEFPGENGGYFSLLDLADASEDPSRVRAVVREILRSPASFAARARAQILEQRYDLLGKSLADFASTALGRDSVFERSREHQAIVYSWASWSAQSLALGRTLAKAAPAGALVYGVNLDHDVAAARVAAEREQLPGLQLYHEGGIGSPLALRLKLNSAGMVYVTDAQGVIRDVGAQRGDLAQRIETAGSASPQR